MYFPEVHATVNNYIHGRLLVLVKTQILRLQIEHCLRVYETFTIGNKQLAAFSVVYYSLR